jgi:hypothetical protein
MTYKHYLLLLALVIACLAGCMNGKVNTATVGKVASLALESYGAYSSGNPASIAKAASDDLYGAAALAQAYQGGNSAALVNGANNAAAMADLVSKLPADALSGGKINSSTVTALLGAAATIK